MERRRGGKREGGREAARGGEGARGMGRERGVKVWERGQTAREGGGEVREKPAVQGRVHACPCVHGNMERGGEGRASTACEAAQTGISTTVTQQSRGNDTKKEVGLPIGFENGGSLGDAKVQPQC